MDMDHRRGLQEVRVTKSDLLGKIRSNLDQHCIAFEVAYGGWLEQYYNKIGEVHVAMLESKLPEEDGQPLLNMGEMISTEGLKHVEELLKELRELDKPISHEKAYEQTLELLEASQDEEFVLDAHTFNQYWRDDWSWKTAFEVSSSKYSSAR